MARIVYTTADGRICPECRRPRDRCICRRQKAPPATDGIVRVLRETKGRKGKGVTLVTGVPLEGAQLSELAKRLKRRCGAGGTVKNGVIEIQGDHRDTIVPLLQAEGWTVKRAGG